MEGTEPFDRRCASASGRKTHRRPPASSAGRSR